MKKVDWQLWVRLFMEWKKYYIMAQKNLQKNLVADEMNKVWAKIGRWNELSLCKKMWAYPKKAGKFITKNVEWLGWQKI